MTADQTEITNGNATNRSGVIVRLLTFGVRLNALFWPPMACPIERIAPTVLTGSSMMFRPYSRITSRRL